MRSQLKKRNLKNLKLYDNIFHGYIILILLSILLAFIDIEIVSSIAIVTYILALIFFLFGYFSMIYFQIKSKDWIWLIFTIIFGYIVSIIYYFKKLRETFKEKSELRKIEINKEKKLLNYYKSHKKEIEKKHDEDFMGFLKEIGVLAMIIILGFIISKIFF